MTLTGPAGVGKTRLAVAAAAGIPDAYPDGIVFVDLSPLHDPDLVMPTVAAALGVRELAPQSILATLAQALAAKRLLLVLDNCERVLPAAPEVSALLAACPGLTVLATSRQRLVQPGFALTEENAGVVVNICRRLDGLPLAIELAAARVKVLPLQALLQRLEARLPLLTDGDRDLPARQRTMRDAVAWSYDLLSANEKALFRRLSVFGGGFTLAAAEEIAAADGPRDVFTGIAALVDISLLGHEEDRTSEPRFRMLEIVREYGLEQLATAGEDDDVRQRHAHHFLSRAESLTRGAPLFVNLESTAALAKDQDNLRLALIWCDERGEADVLLRLSTALYGLWLTRGSFREGLQWLERALARSRAATSRFRVEALITASRLAAWEGDYARAATFIAEGLVLARELGEPLLVAQTLNNAGFLSYRRGAHDQAARELGESHCLLQELADEMSNTAGDRDFLLLLLGDVALAQEKFDEAAKWYEETLLLLRDAGHHWGSIDAQAGLAGVYSCTGNTVQATALYLESLDRARDLGITLAGRQRRARSGRDRRVVRARGRRSAPPWRRGEYWRIDRRTHIPARPAHPRPRTRCAAIGIGRGAAGRRAGRRPRHAARRSHCAGAGGGRRCVTVASHGARLSRACRELHSCSRDRPTPALSQ